MPLPNPSGFEAHTNGLSLISLTQNGVVGGDLLPIDTTALLLATSQSPIAWLTTMTFAIIGVGAFLITRNPCNIRKINAILRDYLDRF